MVKVREDMTGWKMWEHGVPESRLTVIKQVEDYIVNGMHYAQYLCECSCKDHKQLIVMAAALRSGNTLSCGCVQKEKLYILSKKENQYDLSGEYGIGYTFKGEEFYFDLDDYSKIKEYCWCINKRGYVVSYNFYTNKQNSMHRLLFPEFKIIDHINHNKRDNRKDNLREATKSQNSMNSNIRSNNASGITGVSWDKNRNQWRVSIGINNKNKNLGRFDNIEDAIRAREEAEKKYFGEYGFANSCNKLNNTK